MTKDLNDRLDDIFGAPTARELPQTPAAVEYRAQVAQDAGYFQKCGRCNGTGQTPWGVCFRCKGAKGKTFKTSPESRAKASEARRDRVERVKTDARLGWIGAFPAEHAWLVATAPRWDLAASLLAQVNDGRDLSDRQLEIVRNGIARDAVRAAERAARAAAAPQVDVSRLEAAFAKARASAARPGQLGVWTKPLKLRSGDKETGIDISFKDGTPGTQWEGMLFVKNAAGDKLGFVKDGRFQKRFSCTPAEEAAVLDVASDPAKAATAWGKAWSRCSVCGKTLTNDQSIGRAMGPICAERFGF